MSIFEYLIALVSVVVGLAVAHALGGLLRIVHNRETIRVDWLPLVWTGTLLLWIIFFWWFTFAGAEAPQWRMRDLLFVLGYAAAIYFVLGLLYPHDIGPGFDMRAHFETSRRWFYGSLLGLGGFDSADTVLRIVTDVVVPEPFYYVVLGTLLVGSVVGWRAQSRRFHTAFAITFSILVVIQVVFNTRMILLDGSYVG